MTDVTSAIKGKWGNLPAGIRFHSGHTWARLVSDNMVFVGATEFAIKFTGSLTGLSLPRSSEIVREGEPTWTFLSRNGRTLGQASAIGGQVLVANSDLLEDPSELRRSPHQGGWLLCLRSPDIARDLGKLGPREADRAWLDRTLDTMEAVWGSPLRVPFQDGTWRPEFGDEFSDEEWGTLRKKLFPAYPLRTLPRVG